MRKNACILLILLALFSFLPSISYASESYVIAEAELTQLENNLDRLKVINNRLQKESNLQKKRMTELETQLTEAQNELKKAKEQSNLLRSQLKELEMTSTRQEESLRTANAYLEMCEKENNRTKRRLKAQRNVAYTLSAALIYAYIRK